MKHSVNKITVKRFLLGLLQQVLALSIAILVAVIAMNSYIIVDNMYGEKVKYNIAFLENSEAFEESDIFTDMFRNSITDITRFVVYLGQMETDEEYDGDKHIDVNEYANRISAKNNPSVTAVYRLGDLIKWDRYGMQMQEWSFKSKTEFLTYFDNVDYLYQVCQEIGEEVEIPYTSADDGAITEEVIESAKRTVLTTKMTHPDKVDRMFEHVMSEINRLSGKTVEVVEDSDQIKVKIKTLTCRYKTVDGYELLNLVDNWEDYCMLEANVIETIDNMGYNYSQYINRNEVYDSGNTNVQFLIRIRSAEGVKYYTNLPETQLDRDEVTLNEHFETLGKYVIYSPDNMKFDTNTDISEEEMFNNVSEYSYAFPTNTKIWIGIDTKFKVENDQYAHVYETYNNIVPHIWKFLLGILFCGLGWLILWVYFTLTTGKVYDETGKVISRLNLFDKIPTEIVGIMMFASVLGFVVGYLHLTDVLENNIYFQYDNWISDTSYSRFYFILMISGYGVLMSIAIQVFWCSFVRRLRFGVLWKESICCKILHMIYRIFTSITDNRMVVVRTLIPYNAFLIYNLGSILGIYLTIRSNRLYFVLCVLLLVMVDTAVGVYIFKRSSEVNDIIDGVSRIRAGDVNYVLDSEKLHGENKELAEAVNNIGEGIRIAVETSMKDERTKADLITNVSHDIKTPLTSIINYVALLKREKIETEPVKGYIDILDVKTQRLKHLTDDLVEASKISSGNIVLENSQMDLYELIKQATGEFSEKFEDCSLQVVINECQDYTAIYADSRRMWRVVENLYNNVCKYAMPNTRVYIDIHNDNGKVEASVKNISANPLNIKPEELTERFIRGDISRTTEGSGLGLSIARNLTELQGGELVIFLDGDLFKVTIRFPEFRQE